MTGNHRGRHEFFAPAQDDDNENAMRLIMFLLND